MFQCDNLYREDTATYYLTSNYDIQCYTKEHLSWTLGLGVPDIAIWGLIFPLGAFAILFRNRYQLEDPRVRRRYAFLYRGYERTRYYWEFFIIFRKEVLVVLLVFLATVSINLQAILITFILFFALYIHSGFRPYKYHVLNDVDRFALLSLCVMSGAGLIFVSVRGYPALDTVVLVICGIFNITFLVYWVVIYIRLLYSRYKSTKPVVVATKYLRRVSTYMGSKFKRQRTIDAKGIKTDYADVPAKDILMAPPAPELKEPHENAGLKISVPKKSKLISRERRADEMHASVVSMEYLKRRSSSLITPEEYMLGMVDSEAKHPEQPNE
jgi:hypothetical protein